MRHLPGSCLFFLACALSCYAQQNPGGADENTTVLHDVVIGQGGGHPLHAEVAYPSAPSALPMPAVIWIHGGGWAGGEYKENQAQWLAAHGYFTASIEYRLSGEARWPAQIEDCKLAVRWLRAHAAEYHVDPQKIGVWGESAGAHLVACLGVMGDETQLEGEGGDQGVSSKVQAVVCYYGAYDFTAGSAGIQRSENQPADYESPALMGLFGGSFKAKGDLWKQGSPIGHVKAGDPPFLLVHGDKDLVVPIGQARKMADALNKAGVPVEFITVKNAGHGLVSFKSAPPPAPDRATLNAAVLAFFDKNLK